MDAPDTEINGGLVLTSLIGLRDTGGNTTAGINGITEKSAKGGGIAAWFGGEMVDKDYNDGSKTPANTIFRFDGSGYVAGGAIWWGTDGRVHADPTSFIISEKNLGAYLTFFEPTWKAGSAGTSVADLVSLKPNAPFTKLGVSGDAAFEGAITFHGIKLTYDATNKAIKIDGNLYATGGISAYGAGSGSSGGGGLNGSVKSYVDAINLTTENLSEVASAYSVAKLKSLIDEIDGSAPTEVDWSIIKNKPTTLAGYGIIDGVNSVSTSGSGNAVTGISISGHTITQTKGTFLTSHQSLAGYATQSWVQNTATAHNADTCDNVHITWAGALTSTSHLVAWESNGSALRDIAPSSLKLSQFTDDILSGKYLSLSGGTLTGHLNGTTAIFGGRIYNSGDDEGILIKKSSNSLAGLILGGTTGNRAVLYLSSASSLWRFSKDGTEISDIVHPNKSGTIALTSDIPTKLSSLSNDSGYITSSGSCNYATSAGNATSANEATRALKLKDYNGDLNIWCGFIGSSLTANEFNSIVGIKYEGSNNAYYKDVTRSTLQTWLGLGARAYDDTNYLPLSGGTITGSLRINHYLFAYRYGINNNAPAIVFDKPGGRYTGIGSCGVEDTIYFGAVNADDMSWDVNYNQIWVFSGRISQPVGKSLYLGRADNAGWIYCQDIASESGTSIWAIHKNSGNAEFSGTVTTGNLLSKGGVTAYSSSDIRLKQDLRKLDYLGIIKAMGGTFGFAWKKDNTRSIGWIAQHVLCNPHLKDIVETDENGYYKINYWSPKLIATAFGAIEQVGDEVSRLKARVVFLESEVQRLSGKQDGNNKKRLDNKNINLLN